MARIRSGMTYEEELSEQLKDPYFKQTFEDELARLHIGYEIAKMRGKLGLSQVELAKRAKTTQPVISRIEQGGDVKVSTLSSLAQAMGVTMEFRLVKSNRKAKSKKKPKHN